MTDLSKYNDLRRDFFKKHFNAGLTYDEYLSTGSVEQQKRWNEFANSIELSGKQIEKVGGFKRKLKMIVLSGIWCGDCARQGPILRKIEEVSNCIELRYLESKDFSELQEELRILGGTRVPVTVALSEDFFELSRFGDRTLSAYRRKSINELGPACDSGLAPPSADEISEELDEWLAHFERLELMLRLAPMLRQRYQD